MKKLILFFLLFVTWANPQSITFPPAPGGLRSAYFGVSGGTTQYNYWVQAVYPNGRSAIVGPTQINGAPSTLDNNNVVNVTWDSTPGAISFDVFRNSSGTTPSGTCCAVGIRVTANGIVDNGLTVSSTYTIIGNTGTISISPSTTVQAFTVPLTQGGSLQVLMSDGNQGTFWTTLPGYSGPSLLFVNSFYNSNNNRFLPPCNPVRNYNCK